MTEQPAPAAPPPRPGGGAPRATGAEAITHRRILAIGIPIVISNATVPILGAVDTGVVGQLGEAAPIGAVSLGAIVLSAIYWTFGFLRMGTAGLVAQARGAGDAAESGALLSRALLTAAAAGLFLILFQLPLVAIVTALAPASAEIEALASDYILIRVWSAPALIATYALTGWLVAMERTWAVLVMQVAMNGVNAGLDLLFVLGFGWGVEGVAVATFFAEWTGALTGLWFCRAAFAGGQWRDVDRVFDREKLRRLAAVNGDILIRSVLLEMGFVSFVFVGAGLGDVTVAANQILLQFLMISAYAMDGFAFSAESLVGQGLGARDRAWLRRAARLASLWGLGTSAGFAAGFALAGPVLIDLMTTAPEVREAARGYLFWMVLVPLVGTPAWMLDGIFIGATRTRAMRNAMLLSFAGYAAILWPALALAGNHGLWAAQLAFFALRGATLGVRYPALEAEADAPRPA